MTKKYDSSEINEEDILNSFRKEPSPSVSTTEGEKGKEEMRSEEAESIVHETETTQQEIMGNVKEVKSKTAITKKTRECHGDYDELFLEEAAIPARIGKTVYVRKEYHERIQQIVRVIAHDEVSIFSYIDNVLAHHFATYQKEIQERYDKNIKSLF